MNILEIKGFQGVISEFEFICCELSDIIGQVESIIFWRNYIICIGSILQVSLLVSEREFLGSFYLWRLF